MNEVIFCTGNYEKIENAREVSKSFGVTVQQQALDIAEIQSEDPERILLDKLSKAHALAEQPVIVSDDSWEIPALGGLDRKSVV